VIKQDGSIKLPFIVNRKIFILDFTVSKSLVYPLVNWDQLRKTVPECAYHSENDVRLDQQKIARISFVKEEGMSL
jgi:hypothetical protein